MAATPEYKVYDGREYIASVKRPEDGALIAEFLGGEVRLGHSPKCVIWSQQLVHDGFAESPSESYDVCADKCLSRASLWKGLSDD